MKKNKHPKSYNCEIKLANGEKMMLKLFKDIKNIHLNVDFTNHPAWNKNLKEASDIFEEVNKFKQKFKNLQI